MSSLQIIYLGILVLLPVSDAVLIRRYRGGRQALHFADRSSLVILWACVVAALFTAYYLRRFEAARIEGPRALMALLAILLMTGGLILRGAAIVTLGPFFSVNVGVTDDQQLISRGVYRRLRHPAYTGVLMMLIGLGLGLANWLSLCALVCLPFAAVRHRIRIEEKVLRGRFGAGYDEYVQRTKMLVPLIY